MTAATDSAQIMAVGLVLALAAVLGLTARSEDTFRWTGIFTLGVAAGVLLARG